MRQLPCPNPKLSCAGNCEWGKYLDKLNSANVIRLDGSYWHIRNTLAFQSERPSSEPDCDGRCTPRMNANKDKSSNLIFPDYKCE